MTGLENLPRTAVWAIAVKKVIAKNFNLSIVTSVVL